MATSVFKGIASATASRSGDDSVTERYQVTYTTPPTNFYAALILAQSASGTPVPSRFAQYTNGPLFVESISPLFNDINRSVIDWDVTYGRLPQGEDAAQQVENPLDRPIVWDVKFIDGEERIATAKNVDALPRAAGGEQRDALTSGPIVNSAGEQPDEALVRPVRTPLLVGMVNKASPGQIVQLNEDYESTTNSSAVGGWSARRLEFQSAESLGRTTEGDYIFYPCEISIAVRKTTDLVLDNVGWHHWEEVDDPDNPGTQVWKLVRNQIEIVTASGSTQTADAAAPVNLNTDGTLGDDAAPTSVTYRHLEPVSYSNLLNYGT